MKKLYLKRTNNMKGITLIALVISILVILILAGVTIATLTGDNGLLQKVQTAKYTNEKATALEKIQVEVAGSYGLDGKIDVNLLNENLKRINGLKYNNKQLSDDNNIKGLAAIVELNGYSFTIYENGSVGRKKTVEEYPEITVNVLATENSRYISNGKMAIIPAGYTISNVQSEQSIDTGLVITKDGNEWVWIPVSAVDLAAMYTQHDTGWTMFATNVVTKYKTNSEIISEKKRGDPGSTDWREPGVLSDSSSDNNSTNWTVAGFTSFLNMAINLRDDYKEMIDSVKNYGGFYVGRYELSSAGTKKNQASLVNTNWYNLYKACKNIDSTGVVTTMIYGCQWDQVCKFINTLGDKVSLTDSSLYGNYSNSLGNANVSGKGSKQVTGYSDYWKANNIYDIAGNCWEWTQECFSNCYRASRGGRYGNGGDERPVTYRNTNNSNESYDYLSSRPVLYLK